MRAQFFVAKPVLFQKICNVYPPLVKDLINDSMNYSIYSQLLTQSQEMIWDSLSEQREEKIVQAIINGEKIESIKYTTDADAPTPFEVILQQAYSSPEMKKVYEEAFFFFTRERVRIFPQMKKIIFINSILKNEKEEKKQELRYLSEENFFQFQNLIRNACGDTSLKPAEIETDPKRARMKALARKRDRIKNKQKASGVSLATTLAAFCCMGIGINPLNIEEISYAALKMLTKIYSQKESFDKGTMYLAGGANPKEVKAQYWIKNPE